MKYTSTHYANLVLGGVYFDKRRYRDYRYKCTIEREKLHQKYTDIARSVCSHKVYMTESLDVGRFG